MYYMYTCITCCSLSPYLIRPMKSFRRSSQLLDSVRCNLRCSGRGLRKSCDIQSCDTLLTSNTSSTHISSLPIYQYKINLQLTIKLTSGTAGAVLVDPITFLSASYLSFSVSYFSSRGGIATSIATTRREREREVYNKERYN